MILKSIKFSRFKGQPYEWSMEGKPLNGIYNQPVFFQNINLIVGKNATGKSKTINVIRQLSDLLSGEAKLSQLVYHTSAYDLLFEDNGKKITYSLEFAEGKITKEIFTIDGEPKLNRNSEKGEKFYQELGNNMAFQMENEKLAVSLVDKIQQPFFEPLQNWGKLLSHYRFGEQLGKNSYLRDINAVQEDKEIVLKDSDDVAAIFIQGKKKFQEKFINAILDDMKAIDYEINTIDVDTLKLLPITAFGMSVKEIDIEGITDQREMSQGMFRALSLLIQLNFSLFYQIPSCILIDDIGEGLDYERSKSLIDLIIEKVKGSSVQVVMTTNDRFVMNKVPLEYWAIVHRVPKKTLFYNYQNSQEIFDEFKETGLNNFDLFSGEYYVDNLEIANNSAE